MKTTNAKSRQFVQETKPFQANNLKGVIEGDFYVVYSYAWYPLFAYSFKDERWFKNIERYSVSTSKQTTQCNPHASFTLLSLEQMKDLLQGRAVVA